MTDTAHDPNYGLGPEPEPGSIEPIPVHVVNLADTPAPAAHRLRKRYRTVYRTVVLTADDPAQRLLPASDDRLIAWVQALDNDIVLGTDRGEVRAPANLAAGAPFPSGTLVPASNGAPYPVQDSALVWAGATTVASNSRIAITAVYCTYE